MSEKRRASFVREESGETGPDFRIVGLAAPVRHAIQALCVLARNPDLPQDAAALARKCRLPGAALSKSFQRLARRGLLEARRGPGGGYRLTAPAADVTLAQIAAALGAGEERRGRCVLEERSCRGDAPCALHTAAVEADACLGRALRSLTLSDMAFSVRGRMEAL